MLDQKRHYLYSPVQTGNILLLGSYFSLSACNLASQQLNVLKLIYFWSDGKFQDYSLRIHWSQIVKK